MAVTPHLHIGFIEFMIFLTYLLIAGFILRTIEITCAHNPIGKAIAFIY